MSHRVFDRLYERYDEWYRRHPIDAWNELLAVREALHGSPGPCLEVGVGTGWFASKAGCEYGVDPSMGMLRIARARGVEVVLGRGESLPFRDDSFGTVLMVVTLCFVQDPARVLEESARVVRRGGRVVPCIVPRESPWGRHYEKLASRGHPFYSLARFLTVGELVSLLEDAGLRVERMVATLSYGPEEEPRAEEPRSYSGWEGFVCIVAGR
ncbi:MAG: class I SAM-dependent methyltransferase [Desulfurococcales archaeon]|nr:class I SAM-dependent methyltransferase [Desulfurococcales archaeon]